MFSKACSYAIRACLYLSVNASESHKIGVKALAQDLGVPVHFLGKILQDLSRQGLITSVKGPQGGFYLTEANQEQPLAHIVTSIDGPKVFTACALGFEECGSANPCPLHYQVLPYREGLRQQMQEFTIGEMAARVKRKGGKI